jgi:hypothetical protein
MPEGDAGYKWGALVFSPPSGPAGSTPMFGGKETFEGNLLALVPTDQHGHWREWLGSIAWEGIDNAGRVVLARMPSSTASVLDAENERLTYQMRSAWAAFLLSGGAADAGEHAWVLSGQAAGDAPGTALLTIRRVGPQDTIIQPFYWKRDRYTALRIAAMTKRWEERHTREDDSWFRPWVEVDELLTRRPKRPPILALSMLSYSGAWTRTMLEFSTPDYVRAAEGVIALPRNTGRKLFSERAVRLVPRLCWDEYVAADIETLLVELYELRIDCVHGMIPFEKLQALGEAGAERAGQLAYVAEVLAREALLVALRRSDWSVFESRELLEAAWASGAFP